MTKEERNKIISFVMKNSRASMALSGKKISDSNFEKIAKLAPKLWKLN